MSTTTIPVTPFMTLPNNYSQHHGNHSQHHSSLEHGMIQNKINDADHRSTAAIYGSTKDILGNEYRNTSDLMGSGYRNTSDLMGSGYRNTSDILASNCKDTADILANESRDKTDTITTLGVSTDRILSGNDRNSIALTGNVNRSSDLNLTATERVAVAQERIRGDLSATAERISGETRGLVKDANRDTLIGLKETLLGVNESKSELLRQNSEYQTASQLEGAKNTAAVQLEASKNYGLVQFEASKNFGLVQFEAAKNSQAIQLGAAKHAQDIQLDACKNTASLQLEASKNLGVLSSKIDECCCEIKGLVQSTSTVTQQLIGNAETNRVRDALSASTTENMFLRFQGSSANGPGRS